MKRRVFAALMVALVVTMCTLAPCSALAATPTFSVSMSGEIWDYYGDAVFYMTKLSSGNWQYSIRNDIVYFIPFVEPVTFQKDYFYQFFYGLTFSKSSGTDAADNVTVSVLLTLHSTDGYWLSDSHSFSLDGSLSVPTVEWMCTNSFTCDGIIISLSSDSDDLQYATLTVSPTMKFALDDGLEAPEGVDTDDTTSGVDGVVDAKGDIELSLGGGGGFGGTQDSLENIMILPQFGEGLIASFSQISTLFTRVVTTCDLSVAITFMLLFGLALFVIGRRVR